MVILAARVLVGLLTTSPGPPSSSTPEQSRHVIPPLEEKPFRPRRGEEPKAVRNPQRPHKLGCALVGCALVGSFDFLASVISIVFTRLSFKF